MATQNVITYVRNELLPCQDPMHARENSGQFKPNLNLLPGTVVALDSSVNLMAAYVAAGTNGLNVPLGFLRYGVATDANGNIINFDEWGVLEDDAPYYYQGKFYTTELVGFDANAMTVLGAHLIAGTLAAGVIAF